MWVVSIHRRNKSLKDIYLSFYYGAKIGVIGLNGSGKSTLLRIIAGLDKDYIGEITMSKGYTVGLLEQEPQLDKISRSRKLSKKAAPKLSPLLHEYEAVSNKLGENIPSEEMEKLFGEAKPAPGKDRGRQRLGAGE